LGYHKHRYPDHRLSSDGPNNKFSDEFDVASDVPFHSGSSEENSFLGHLVDALQHFDKEQLNKGEFEQAKKQVEILIKELHIKD